MRYGPLQTFSDPHVVTAAEAAYTTLFGLFLPRRGFVWSDSIAADLRIEREEWLVEQMDVHHYDSTGLRYQGRVMELFAVQPAGTGPVDLPSTGVQWLNQRFMLERPRHVTHGVGFRYAQVAGGVSNFYAGDGIQMTVAYRLVFP